MELTEGGGWLQGSEKATFARGRPPISRRVRLHLCSSAQLWSGFQIQSSVLEVDGGMGETSTARTAGLLLQFFQTHCHSDPSLGEEPPCVEQALARLAHHPPAPAACS